MAWGNTGVRCLDCETDWNYTWNRKNNDLVVLCPNCQSGNVAVLDQTVPFAIGDGGPPDYIFHCICGGVFQHPPKKVLLDAFDSDIQRLKKTMEVKCHFCGRTNQEEFHIPKQ